ncbi:ROK family protein [Candidatus Galacturonibacter soehngenii]|uniref:fructokinase n=1 Tax=Candidatus Galacturonatibacter soehngenii TaxID=2307010 RepID=A0A7V7QNJ6_9FIRM|nr:ROK family protein [Candidatus Galacturonibacter soehngenii]KAB1440549.1 ROK family protein [Candidatus Galacturonibacter soehngenii]
MIFGALEAGGTKMVCALGKEDGTILEQISIPTKTPEETIPFIIDYFKDKEIVSLGVGSFGPVDVNKDSDMYGHILDTPKTAWKYYDLLGNLEKELNVPIGLDTDVNGSCLGEITFGSSKGLDNVVYITIGTGVGVGAAVNGQLLHGMLHPEAGHILLRQHPQDSFAGNCPYHGTCLEGLAAGPAIEKRWGKKAVELKDVDKVWEIEAYYIAQALVNYILTLAPRRIILGGGVMHQKQLFPLIRKEVKELMNGYINTKEIKDLDQYIVPASLNDDQGIMGCIQLAKLALQG